MNSGEPSREKPYRSPAPKPEPDSTLHETVENPLAAFAKHEKHLAILDIYRQTIAACRTQHTLNALKSTCRGTMVTRFPASGKDGPSYLAMRQQAAEASIWLQKLTLDEAALFDQKKEEVPATLSSNYARDMKVQLAAVLVLASLTVLSWLWNHLR